MNEVFMNKIDVIILIIRILVYSAIKINANILLPYSTLNPETSSDSPSAKSKGVRFVSARVVINQKMNIGKRRISIGGNVILLKRDILNEIKNSSRHNKINAILTS
jgi:hypothetical protein